jgi:DedD protein
MGLFSFFGKNKQGRAAEDSGRFYSKDDDAALGERARSKRASSAGAVAGSTRGRGTGNDPLLPEKKRARRRLVGAIALALAAAVGLPMLLDSQPKPLAGDIAIQIPSKDKAAPLPAPSEPAAQAPVRDKAVALEDSVDKDEEVLQAPPAAKPAPAPATAKPQSMAEPEHKLEPKPEHKPEPKPEHKPEPKAEHKPEPKPEHKLADKAEKADKPAKPKSEDKPAKPHDDVRAMAILEGKEKAADAGAQKFVLQVAALSSQEKAAELQARLREAGISAYTQKGATSAGELVRVKIGPLSKDEAEKVRAKLGRMGLSPSMTPV